MPAGEVIFKLMGESKSAQKAASDLSASFGGLVSKTSFLAGAFGTLGSKAVKALIWAFRELKDIAVESIGNYAEYNLQIQTMGAVANMSTPKIREMSNWILKTSIGARFTATEIAKTSAELSRLGLKADEIKAVMTVAQQFAVGIGKDLTPAAQMLFKTMNVAGKSMTDLNALTRTADALAAALNSSVIDFDSLTTAMYYAGSSAIATKQNIIELVKMLAFFSNVGLSASTAGTVVRNIIASLGTVGIQGARGVGKSTEAFKKFGLNAKDFNIQGRGVLDILKRMNEAGFEFEDVLKVFEKRFAANITTMIKATGPMSKQHKIWMDISDAVDNSAGALMRLYLRMNEGLGPAQDKISKGWQSFKTILGENLSKIFELEYGYDELIVGFQSLGEGIKAVTYALTGYQSQTSGMKAFWTNIRLLMTDLGKWLEEKAPEIALKIEEITTAIGNLAVALSGLERLSKPVLALANLLVPALPATSVLRLLGWSPMELEIPARKLGPTGEEIQETYIPKRLMPQSVTVINQNQQTFYRASNATDNYPFGFPPWAMGIRG